MEKLPVIVRAKLIHISLKKRRKKESYTEEKHQVEVQFNPESLKLNHSNTIKGGNKPRNSRIQGVSNSKTTLSLDLIFDTTSPERTASIKVTEQGTKKDKKRPAEDVRNLTDAIAFFIKPIGKGRSNKKVSKVRLVRFSWGSFIFDGVMESMNENLEYFSENGVPLRAKVSIKLRQQQANYEVPDTLNVSFPPPGQPDSTPAAQSQAVKDNERAQELAAKQGNQGNWQLAAEAAGIETPRFLQPGSVLDLSGNNVTKPLNSLGNTSAANLLQSSGNALPVNLTGSSGGAGIRVNAGLRTTNNRRRGLTFIEEL